MRMPCFPNGKRFALNIFDDTDNSTVENVGPVYDLLSSLGIRITKSVWPIAPREQSYIGGDTLAVPEYLSFVQQLRDKGFEIGFHNATSHDCLTDVTEEGIAAFVDLIGYEPKVHCNHANNRENIYWGVARLRSPLLRAIYRVATFRQRRKFEGHVPSSDFFWGELCHSNITYVRNFVFRELNLLRVNPTMPYHDPQKPYVKWWFSSTNAPNVDEFCKVLNGEAQQRLEDEGGVAILYTHFANGFAGPGGLNKDFVRVMTHLSQRNGWFVPVGELLDHLRDEQIGGEISKRELRSMERRWLLEKMLHGTS